MSKHLRVLREVGLVAVRGAGRQRLYRLTGAPLKTIHDWVRGYEQTWSAAFDHMDGVLDDLRSPEAKDMTMATKGSATVTLPSDEEILIRRHFDAPQHLVWRTYTEPELVARWWHASRGTVQSIDIDLRVGGKWRYVMMANPGFEVAFHGEYREVVENEHIVSTEVFEGAPEAPAVSTVTFEAADGGTTLSILVHHLTQANRQANDIGAGRRYAAAYRRRIR